MQEVSLRDIEKGLNNCLIRLNYDFLKKLIISSAKTNTPHLNKKYILKIGLKFNEEARESTGISQLLRKNRAIKFSTLRKIKDLSDYNWEDIEKNIISIRAGRKKGEIKLQFPIKIDQKLGSIIGHILGDGAISKKYTAVYFSNSCKDLLNEFINQMEETFGVRPRIWVQERRKFEEKSRFLKRVTKVSLIPKYHNAELFYPSMCGIMLHLILGKFAYGKEKKLTKEILGAPKEFKIGLIRAFFDDEGSVYPNHHMLRFHQDNKQILEDIKRLLKEQGINSNPIRRYIKREKERHYFNITRFKEYYQFYKLIGCTHPEKDKKLKLLIQKVKNSRKFKYQEDIRDAVI